MMIRRIVCYLIGIWLLWGMISCNNTKYLPANESLYTGAEIKIENSDISKKKRKALTAELLDLTRPKPNASVFGLRPKLWFYNIGGNPKRKISVRRLIKNMGEPPVVLSDLNIEKNNAVLQNHLENNGFFRAEVSGEVDIKKRRAQATYHVHPGPEYLINKVEFDKDSSVVQKAINRTIGGSLLKPGKPFELDMIKEERARIDSRLKNRGFYFFSEDHLIVDVDTTIGDHKVNLFVRKKQNIPNQAKRIYRINDVVIYPTYDLANADEDTSKKFGVMHYDYLVVDSSKSYKPRLFQQAMQFDKGDIYRRSEHNATLNRLINMGIFKFVKNRFETAGDTLLNAYYYLTPMPKKSLRAQIGGSTKSNNLTGSQLTLGFTNRNAFRGGELLTVNANAGAEVQVSGQFRGFNTYRLGGEVKLGIPRFVIPLININPRGGFVPRTNILVGYDWLYRQRLYTLNSFRMAYGYSWKESAQKEHNLYPISIQYVQPLMVTQLYKDSLGNNPALQKIIDTQFILGATYNYQYNQLIGRVPNNAFYFNGLIDVSGNIAGLINRNIIKEGDTARMFGAPFSQYVKAEFDFRYYRKLDNNGNVWANRLIIGTGLPYGNSRELPFIKQFFAGGNNSLRGFRSRSVGPGSYRAPGLDVPGSFVPDQTGDLKLEINSELRFRIVKPVFGALFIDAGNVWLYNESAIKPGAKLSNNWFKEMAASTGVGIRLDLSVLVLRLDLAFPIRKPWLPESERWVFDQISLGDRDWRRQNLIFNLAIGHAF